MSYLVRRATTPMDTITSFTTVEDSALLWMADTGLSASGEIDLRSQMVDLLRARGHMVFLRRALSVRAPTYNRAAHEAKPKSDQYNWGGFLYEDELIKVRARPTYSESAGAVSEFLTAFGQLTLRHRIFYMAYDANPSIRDGIIYVTLDSDGTPQVPYDIESIYDIQVTYPFRDQGGRIEYWAVLGEERVFGK